MSEACSYTAAGTHAVPFMVVDAHSEFPCDANINTVMTS